MKKGIIFDLDGTLINSIQDLADSTNRVLTKHQLKTHELVKYNHFVGNGMKKLIERAIEPHNELLDICLKEFYEDYSENCLVHTYLYEGIRELIDKLCNDGYKLAVVTNKPHHIAVKIMKLLFDKQFVVVLGQQDQYPKKPDPTLVYEALKIMSLSIDECFYVGDSDVDIITAKNAGMDSIGVVWGFRGERELKNEGATYIVYHPHEIMEVLT